MDVSMLLTLFLQGTSPPVNPPANGFFLITGFLICHSFLDFLYIEYFAAVFYFSLYGEKTEIDFGDERWFT